MIKFLFKGLLRDPHRSKIPVIVVSIGVMLTVFLFCYLKGVMGDSVDMTANFMTGHVKITSKAYDELADQLPNDLALTNTESFIADLKQSYPEMQWVERIKFGGLIDAPDSIGETRSQGPVIGFAVSLFNPNDGELKRMNIEKSLKTGKIPQKAGEILISDQFAKKLDVVAGDEVTLIGSTMYGSMAFYNFIVSGTVGFGNQLMDKGSILVDISDAKLALNMENSSSEILGFLPGGFYSSEPAHKLMNEFNEKYKDETDVYAPIMKTIEEQEGMGPMLAYANNMGSFITLIFIFVLAIVLWNAGLLGGIRRYGEFGLRIAIGENKSNIYKTMIYEAILFGMIGSVIGTAFGLFFSWLLQTYGFDVSSMMKDINMMMPTVFRARISPEAFYLGFFPGIIATLIGTMLAGIGIFKRKTATLFNELEN